MGSLLKAGHLWKRRELSVAPPNTGDPENFDTARACKRVQKFVPVALILFPQPVRQVVQEYRSEQSER